MKNIKAQVLPDNIMREIGFTDYRSGYWHFMKILKGIDEISFNVTIQKDNPENISIRILDENFGQPYDYQYILQNNPTFKPCLIVKEQVEEWTKYLEEKGIIYTLK